MLVTNFRLKYVLYKLVCGFYQLFDVGRIHPMRERSLRALERTVDYIERALPDALGFDSQRELIEYALAEVKIDGHYLEFGVYTGGTIRFIASRIGKRIIHGFDSFEGLPEAWGGFNLGRSAFDAGGKLPRVPGNVRLHRGLFDASLPPWLKDNSGPAAFVHVDCDLYSSTQTIFTLLADRIAPGTVILFDEYFNFPNWEQHEYKAFQEFVARHGVTYTYLGFARQQVAVRVDSRDSSVELTIFISCYNEEPFVVKTIETVRAALAEAGRSQYEIIVIDDCSKDRSANLVEDYIRTHPDEPILLRRNKRNQGLAQNYFDAAFIGKGKYYRLICGDDAEPMDTMVTVFREIGQADMLIPYYISSEGKSFSRRMISNTYSRLVNFISGFRLHYYNGLAVHLRYNVMRWHPNTRGFGFQADIICMLLDQGFTYKEIPVRTIERKKGDSKALTFKNMLSVSHTIVDIIVRRIANRVNRWM